MIRQNNIANFIITLFLFYNIISCCEDRNYDYFYGKWKYIDKKGDHNEFWVNSEKALLANEMEGQAKIFTYEIIQDTLKLYIRLKDGNRHLSEVSYIKRIKKNKMIIVQGDYKAKLERIDENVPELDTVDDFEFIFFKKTIVQ